VNKTIVLLGILVSTGCTTLPTQYHATERHCEYHRVGVDYAPECRSKGTVELDDGLDLLR